MKFSGDYSLYADSRGKTTPDLSKRLKFNKLRSDLERLLSSEECHPLCMENDNDRDSMVDEILQMLVDEEHV